MYGWVSQVVSCPQIFPTKTLYTPLLSPYALHDLPISFFSIPPVPALSPMNPIHIIPSNFFDIILIHSCLLCLGLFPSELHTRTLFALPSWPVPWNKNESFTYAVITVEPVHSLTILNMFLYTYQSVLCRYSNYGCVVLHEITGLPTTGFGNTTSFTCTAVLAWVSRR